MRPCTPVGDRERAYMVVFIGLGHVHRSCFSRYMSIAGCLILHAHRPSHCASQNQCERWMSGANLHELPLLSIPLGGAYSSTS